jgi:hypothetical protein
VSKNPLAPRTAWTDAQREAIRARDKGYRDRAKEREEAEAQDEYDGDPLQGICALLLLLHSDGRRQDFARAAIVSEVERLFDATIYAQNRDTVSMEKNQRLAELYSLGNSGGGRKNGFPVV